MRVPEPGPVLTPPIAVTLDCPAGTVPGWLGEDGLPTSCVGDDPLVLPEIGVPLDVFPPALPLSPLPEVLAMTGAGDVWQWMLLALCAVFIGVFVVAGFRESSGE